MPYRQEVCHGDAHEGPADVGCRIGGQRYVALDNVQRDEELGEGCLIGNRLVKDIRQLHQLRPDAVRQGVLEDVRLIPDRGHQIVHLPARGQHLQQSVVQVIVAIQSQADRSTAHHGHDREGHLQAGNGVGRTWFSVAAAGHQIEEQSQQGDNEQGSRHRAQNTQTLWWKLRDNKISIRIIEII